MPNRNTAAGCVPLDCCLDLAEPVPGYHIFDEPLEEIVDRKAPITAIEYAISLGFFSQRFFDASNLALGALYSSTANPIYWQLHEYAVLGNMASRGVGYPAAMAMARSIYFDDGPRPDHRHMYQRDAVKACARGIVMSKLEFGIGYIATKVAMWLS